MSKLRDHIWLWGHPENRYYNLFGNTQISRMTPMEGALYLGARNLFMVPVDIGVNRRQYNKSFTTLRQTGWEIWAAGFDPAFVEPLIEEAKEFKNIGCGVLDDFIRGGAYKNMPLENLYKVRDRLHLNEVRRLDMWMVLYTHEFGEKPEEDKQFMPYIEPFDGIIFWTWKESDLVLFEEKFRLFKEMTEGKRRMIGCYLWNFGEEKPSSPEAVKWELDRYRELLLAGDIEGIVLHTNTMADLDLEAYDVAVAWMEEHGNDEIPD